MLRNLALATSLAVAAAPVAAYAAPAAIVETSRVAAPTPGSTNAARDYAEREQQDTQAASFVGGDIVVIGVSGGALVVLLFLLLILV